MIQSAEQKIINIINLTDTSHVGIAKSNQE